MGCRGRYLGFRGWRQHETRVNSIKRSFVICTPRQILHGSQIKEDGICGARGMHREEDKYKALVQKQKGMRPLGRHRL